MSPQVESKEEVARAEAARSAGKRASEAEGRAKAAEEKAEELASKVLDLEHECREASASETAAIDRARKVERQMLEIRKRLQSDDLAREVADALHVDGKYALKPASFRAQREAEIRPTLSTAEILLTRDAASCVGDDA